MSDLVRARPPAYARELITARRMGVHPLEVDVLFARDWGVAKARAAARGDVPFERWVRAGGVPCVVVSPREYAPGAVDWLCLTGLMVNLVADAPLYDDCYLIAGGCYWGPLYSVIGEIAQCSAGIWLKRDVAESPGTDAQGLAYSYSLGSVGGKPLWPAWWSDEVEARIEKRNARWYGLAFNRLVPRDERRAGA